MLKKCWLLVLVLGCASCCWGYLEDPSQMAGMQPARSHVTASSRLLATVFAELDVASIDSVTVTPDGNRLWSIQGDLSEPLSGDLKRASLDFLQSHAHLFNLPESPNDETFRVVRNEESAGGRHISFQLMIEGYPVHDGRIDLHLSRDRRIRLAHGSYPTVSRVVNTVRITRNEAIERAKKILGTKNMYETPIASMELFPANQAGDFVSAYIVAIPSKDPLGSFRLTIDAETGAELDRTNEMWFEHEGRGSVYRNHPLATPLSIEPLFHLASTTLSGLYTSIRNPKAPAANRPDSVHIYDPSDTHFDEVNVYYHLNIAHDFFKSMGFAKLDRPIPAVVHYGDKMDNALFDAGFGVFGFGDGDQYYSFAREESIVYHEYSHCVLNEIVKLRNAGESGAMNEGQADYFGSSLSNDPIHGEYVASKAGIPYIRTLANSFHYPEDIVGGVHKDGRIWSGALWDLRTAVGREVADRLVHGSHFYLKPGQPTFRDGVNALLAADANLFQGRNKAAITSVMSRRGITASAFSGMVFEKQDLRVMKAFNALHGN